MTASNLPPQIPPSGPPPQVPEGWVAEWSAPYGVWYFYNPTTYASTWQNLLTSVPAPIAPLPYASGALMPTPNTEVPHDSSRGRKSSPSSSSSSSSSERGLPPVLNRLFHHHTPNPPPINAHSRPSSTNAQRLYIHAATFSDTDITQKIRSMVTADQTLSLHCDSLTYHFGDPWPNHKKQFSMLYSYGNQPWQIIATTEGNDNISLHPMVPVDPSRASFVQAPTSRVVGLVWGKQNALVDGNRGRSGGLKIAEIEREGRLEASNGWMGFDGWENQEKHAIVYFRHADGSVGVVTGREGETIRLPWNAFSAGGY